MHKPTTVNTEFQLYNGSITGTPLASGQDSTGEVLTLGAATPGSYYLLAHNQDAAAGTVTCSIDALQALPPLTLGHPDSRAARLPE